MVCPTRINMPVVTLFTAHIIIAARHIVAALKLANPRPVDRRLGPTFR